MSDFKEVLSSRLIAFNLEDTEIINRCENCLLAIDDTIRKIKALVTAHHFSEQAQEVHFFKDLKPPFISEFIYYSKILGIEASKPAVGDKALRKYFEYELKKLKNFHLENSDFFNYYRREATYLDHKYFIRYSYDFKMNMFHGFHNFDENFCTSHDHLIAQIYANQRVGTYLKKALSEIGLPVVAPEPDFKSNLHWSSSKAGLVELIYALHNLKCFHHGALELNEIIRTFEQMFNIDLNNFHKTLIEIKNRKTEPTKFLKTLQDHLQQKFLDADR